MIFLRLNIRRQLHIEPIAFRRLYHARTPAKMEICAPMTISDIPATMLGDIFDWLVDKTDKLCARGVCQRWRLLIEEPKLNGYSLHHIAAARADYIFWCSSYEGNYELAKCALAKEPSYWTPEILEYRMKEVCQLGYYRIAVLLYAHGSPISKACLFNACNYGHFDLASFLIAKNSDVCFATLCDLCESGDLRAVNFLAGRCAFEPAQWEEAFLCACQAESAELVNFVATKAKNADFNEGLNISCTNPNGRATLARALVQLGATNVDRLFEEACIDARYDVARVLLDLGATNAASSLINACKFGEFESVEFLLDNSGPHDINAAFLATFEGEENTTAHENARIALINGGVINYNVCMSLACNKRVSRAFEALISLGATQCANCSCSMVQHLDEPMDEDS